MTPNVPPPPADDGLRRHGIEVTTEAEAGLLRAADEEHVTDP